MKQLKGYQPLCIIKEKVLLYKKGKLFLYDEKTDSYQTVMKLKVGLLNKIKEESRLISRLFRMGVRNALPISENEVLLTFDKALFHVSLSDKKVTKLIKMKKGFSNPLNLCAPLKGTKYIALFGDYGNNADRQSVSIYGVDESLSIKKVYTFPPKTIRHIHNIICDELNNGYYVLLEITSLKPEYIGLMQF